MKKKIKDVSSVKNALFSEFYVRILFWSSEVTQNLKKTVKFLFIDLKINILVSFHKLKFINLTYSDRESNFEYILYNSYLFLSNIFILNLKKLKLN